MDEVLVIDLCFGCVQFPICGGGVAIFRGYGGFNHGSEKLVEAYVWDLFH